MVVCVLSNWSELGNAKAGVCIVVLFEGDFWQKLQPRIWGGNFAISDVEYMERKE
jgi:hypothetical protein